MENWFASRNAANYRRICSSVENLRSKAEYCGVSDVESATWLKHCIVVNVFLTQFLPTDFVADTPFIRVTYQCLRRISGRSTWQADVQSSTECIGSIHEFVAYFTYVHQRTLLWPRTVINVI